MLDQTPRYTMFPVVRLQNVVVIDFVDVNIKILKYISPSVEEYPS